ncbi:hypothetical protein MJG53_006716 [Ovis ammon polii x Ovis aries]|uniref:Uncharacterized protein n=1 Tax=Ovis ammon polii x Ovis aries TaxID=2918886 RepID=A0ACB9V5K8_9CETA|nr:hypothetical protein MJG53_006716 [Ovis ammon polii x Ovis aries]
MPGARGARCGAALWLGLLGGIFCRAWTAPATSLTDTGTVCTVFRVSLFSQIASVFSSHSDSNAIEYEEDLE